MKPHEQTWRQCHQELRSVETSDGYLVAEAYPAGDGGFAEVCDVARLIAAAPDMARALLFARQALAEIQKGHRLDWDGYEALHASITTALRKAGAL